MILQQFAPGVVALAATLVGVAVVMSLAPRIGAVVTPRTDRWGRRQIPTLGGLAIVAGITAGLLVDATLAAERVAILSGLAVLLVVGLVDDLHTVSPGTRIVVQVIVGAGVGWVIGDGVELRLAGLVAGVVIVPVSVNATNLVDNTDGLAAGLSAASAAGFMGGATVLGLSASLTPVGFAIIGACLGFLAYNRPPARVFMGDAGSLPLGFALAVLALLLLRNAARAPDGPLIEAAVVAGVALAVQLGDVAMVFITRLRRSDSPFRGGVDHTSHRLILLGLGSSAMLLSLTLLSVMLQLVAFVALSLGQRPAITIALAFGVVLAVGLMEAAVVRATGGATPTGRAA